MSIPKRARPLLVFGAGGETGDTDIPRRAIVEKWTPAEKAIVDAIRVVEEAGADERLTDAVVLLQAARDSVADYVDGVEHRRHLRVGVYEEIADELCRARKSHGPMASAMEANSVILEEYEEMWAEIKHGTPEKARAEAVQLAAMAIRLVEDVYDRQ